MSDFIVDPNELLLQREEEDAANLTRNVNTTSNKAASLNQAANNKLQNLSSDFSNVNGYLEPNSNKAWDLKGLSNEEADYLLGYAAAHYQPGSKNNPLAGTRNEVLYSYGTKDQNSTAQTPDTTLTPIEDYNGHVKVGLAAALGNGSSEYNADYRYLPGQAAKDGLTNNSDYGYASGTEGVDVNKQFMNLPLSKPAATVVEGMEHARMAGDPNKRVVLRKEDGTYLIDGQPATKEDVDRLYGAGSTEYYKDKESVFYSDPNTTSLTDERKRFLEDRFNALVKEEYLKELRSTDPKYMTPREIEDSNKYLGTNYTSSNYRSFDDLVKERAAQSGGVGEWIDNAARHLGSTAYKTVVLDTADWLSESVAGHDLWTSKEKKKMADELFDVNPYEGQKDYEEIQPIINRIKAQWDDPNQHVSLKDIGKLIKAGFTSSSMAGDSLGYLIGLAIPYLGIASKGSKIQKLNEMRKGYKTLAKDLETQVKRGKLSKEQALSQLSKSKKHIEEFKDAIPLLDKAKYLVKKNAGVLNVSAGQTNDQIDEIRASGEEVTPLKTAQMYATNVLANSLEKFTDLKILRDTKIRDNLRDIFSALPKESKMKILGKGLTISGAVAKDMGMEAGQEYLQSLGEALNVHWKLGDNVVEAVDNAGEVLFSADTQGEAIGAAALGAGGGAQFSAASVGTSGAIKSADKLIQAAQNRKNNRTLANRQTEDTPDTNIPPIAKNLYSASSTPEEVQRSMGYRFNEASLKGDEAESQQVADAVVDTINKGIFKTKLKENSPERARQNIEDAAVILGHTGNEAALEKLKQDSASVLDRDEVESIASMGFEKGVVLTETSKKFPNFAKVYRLMENSVRMGDFDTAEMLAKKLRESDSYSKTPEAFKELVDSISPITEETVTNSVTPSFYDVANTADEKALVNAHVQDIAQKAKERRYKYDSQEEALKAVRSIVFFGSRDSSSNSEVAKEAERAVQKIAEANNISTDTIENIKKTYNQVHEEVTSNPDKGFFTYAKLYKEATDPKLKEIAKQKFLSFYESQIAAAEDLSSLKAKGKELAKKMANTKDGLPNDGIVLESERYRKLNGLPFNLLVTPKGIDPRALKGLNTVLEAKLANVAAIQRTMRKLGIDYSSVSQEDYSKYNYLLKKHYKDSAPILREILNEKPVSTGYADHISANETSMSRTAADISNKGTNVQEEPVQNKRTESKTEQPVQKEKSRRVVQEAFSLEEPTNSSESTSTKQKDKAATSKKQEQIKQNTTSDKSTETKTPNTVATKEKTKSIEKTPEPKVQRKRGPGYKSLLNEKGLSETAESIESQDNPENYPKVEDNSAPVKKTVKESKDTSKPQRKRGPGYKSLFNEFTDETAESIEAQDDPENYPKAKEASKPAKKVAEESKGTSKTQRRRGPGYKALFREAQLEEILNEVANETAESIEAQNNPENYPKAEITSKPVEKESKEVKAQEPTKQKVLDAKDSDSLKKELRSFVLELAKNINSHGLLNKPVHVMYRVVKELYESSGAKEVAKELGIKDTKEAFDKEIFNPVYKTAMSFNLSDFLRNSDLNEGINALLDKYRKTEEYKNAVEYGKKLGNIGAVVPSKRTVTRAYKKAIEAAKNEGKEVTAGPNEVVYVPGKAGDAIISNNLYKGKKTVYFVEEGDKVGRYYEVEEDGDKYLEDFSRKNRIPFEEANIVGTYERDPSKYLKIIKFTTLNSASLSEFSKGIQRLAKYAINSLSSVLKAPNKYEMNPDVATGHETVDNPARSLIFTKGSNDNEVNVNSHVALALEVALEEALVFKQDLLTPADKTPQEIARMLGVEEGEINKELLGVLQNKGMLLDSLANEIGDRVFSLLGLGSGNNKVDELTVPRLKADLGMAAVLMGIQRNWFVIKDVPSNVYFKALGMPVKDADSSVHFVSLNLEENDGEFKEKVLDPVKKNIRSAGEEIKEIGNEVIKQHYEPLDEKYIEEKAKKIRHDMLGIEPSKAHQEALKKLMNIEWELNLPIAKEVLANKDAVLKMLGYVDEKSPEFKRLRFDNKESQRGKNLKLLKDIEVLEEAVEEAEKTGNTSMWFEWFISKNNRFSLESTGINPMGDKHNHRFLVQPKNIKTSYKVKKGKKGLLFYTNAKGNGYKTSVTKAVKYALSQSFGFSVDKESTKNVMRFADTLLNKVVENPEVIDEIKEALLKGESYKLNEEFKVGVEFVSQTFLALDFLSKLVDSLETGKAFDSTLSAEFDAVTSGFGIKLLQTPIIDDIPTFLARVGVMVEGVEGFQKVSSTNDLLGEGYVLDSYQDLASKVGESIDSHPGYKEFDPYEINPSTDKKEPKDDSISKLLLECKSEACADKRRQYLDKLWRSIKKTAPRVVNGEITKELRNLFKDPFMTFQYARSINNIRKGLSENIVNELLDKITSNTEDILYRWKKDKKSVNEYEKNLLVLASNIALLAYGKNDEASVRKLVKELRSKPADSFSVYKLNNHKVYDILSEMVNASYGAQTEEVMSTVFHDFIENNELINNTFIFVYETFKTILDHKVEEHRKEHGSVSRKDKQKIVKSLLNIFPLIHQPDEVKHSVDDISKAIADMDDPTFVPERYNGVVAMYKIANVASDVPYSKVSTHTNGVEVVKPNGKVSSIKQIGVTPKLMDFKDPGVGGTVLSIQTLDSIGMLKSILSDYTLQPIHDAIVPKLSDAFKAVKNYNKNYLETNLEYSIMDNVLELLDRVITVVDNNEEFKKVMENKRFNIPAIIKRINTEITGEVESMAYKYYKEILKDHVEEQAWTVKNGREALKQYLLDHDFRIGHMASLKEGTYTHDDYMKDNFEGTISVEEDGVEYVVKEMRINKPKSIFGEIVDKFKHCF